MVTSNSSNEQPGTAPAHDQIAQLVLWIHAWFTPKKLLGIILLAAYAVAILFDLPTPAGTKYKQDLSSAELAKWGATPVPGAQEAHFWWQKAQGLRGWSNNPEGWVWEKMPPVSILRWLLLLGLAIIGTVLLISAEKLFAKNKKFINVTIICLFIIFGYFFQIITLDMKYPNPEQLLLNRITDKYFTGYLDSSFQFTNINDYFSNYAQTINDPKYCAHCSTHPPGPVLYYWSLHQLITALPSGWRQNSLNTINTTEALSLPTLDEDYLLVAWLGGNLILLITATMVIPLYAIAKKVAPEGMVIPLTALGSVIPGIILMSPQFDQVYAVFSAWLIYLTIVGLSSKKAIFAWGSAAGLFFAFCLFWSIGLAILGVFIVLFAAIVQFTRNFELRDHNSIDKEPFGVTQYLKWLSGFVFGTAILWLFFVLVLQFPILAVLKAIRTDHIFGITAVRPYVPWLFFDLMDFFQFLGLPLLFVVLLSLFHSPGVPRLANHEQINTTEDPKRLTFRHAFKSFLSRNNPVSILFILIILLLDLSGTTRGEVGRLWIFLMPIAVLALYPLTKKGSINLSQLHQLLAAQFIVCALIGANWIVP